MSAAKAPVHRWRDRGRHRDRQRGIPLSGDALLAWQPYGQEGVLVADLEHGEATGLLAPRWRGEEVAG
jgi:hypothetical protein